MRAFWLPLTVTVAAVLSLGACTRSENPHVAQAGEDMKTAGVATGDAAGNLGQAAKEDAGRAADDAKAATARAQVKTGDALERAGRNLKADARP